jgi:hypothetical protein
MNFGMPRNLDFAVERKRPNFEQVPLCANEPLRYTFYLASILTMMVAKGIKKHFPRNWSLIPELPLVPVPAGDPAHNDFLAAVAAREASARKYDYNYPSPSKARFEMLEAKMNADTNNQANILAGLLTDGSPRFSTADQTLMATCLGVVNLENKMDQKEIDVVGEFLIFVKNTVSLSLGQLIDTSSESDRPGVERRPNYVLRTFLQRQEPLCRGNSKSYITVLQAIFDGIGKAETVLQATYVLDQVDYFRNIFDSYMDLHPGAITQIPTDEDYLNSIFYRLKNAGKIHDLHKLLKKVLDSNNIDYRDTMSELRLALQNNKPNIFEPSTLPSYSVSAEKSDSTSVFSHSQTSNSSIWSPNSSSGNDDFFQSYLSLPHAQVLAFHQQQANLGFGGTPVPAPQPLANPPYPGTPSWQSRPPLPPTSSSSSGRGKCNAYPLCAWRGQDGSGCRFLHLDVNGMKNPVLEQIQADAVSSQNLMDPTVRNQWKPSQDLVNRTISALSSNPNDNLQMIEMARKKARYSN